MEGVIISVIKGSAYQKGVLHLLRQAEGKKVCYISLGRDSSRTMENLKSNLVDTSQYCCIDTSKGSGAAYHVQSPNALTELSIAISQALKQGTEVVIFDSLSILNRVTGHKPDAALRFVEHIIRKARAHNTSIVFTCIEDDINSDVVRGSLPLVDNYVNYEPEKIDFVAQQKKKPIYAAFAMLLMGGISVALIGSNNAVTGDVIAPLFDYSAHLQLPVGIAFLLALAVFVAGAILTLFHWRTSR